MIFISCRKDFYDDLDFAQGNAIREVDLTDIENFTTMSTQDLLDRTTGKRVLVLVHGYRNSKDRVASAYKTVEDTLIQRGFINEQYDIVLGYLWPGGILRSGFFISVGRANKAAGHFSDLLARLSGVATSVDVQTHSLGARVALRSLRDTGGAEITVRNLWLLAAAVDDETIEQGEGDFGATRLCQAVYVLHSDRDDVLEIAYRLGDIPEFDAALGWKGPEHPESIRQNSANVKVVDCRNVVESHGGYRNAPETYAHWLSELRSPATEQFVTLIKGMERGIPA